ncbi:MAG: DUF2027 domain-containing protein [Paludibacter sp.]|nr:DUF2027 domain-containing protein [Paludibacter sp.]
MQTTKIKKGDTVRFLNAVGGGIVTRIDEYKGMVYVEDEDGFETPVLERECVAVPKVNAETNFPVKDFSSKPATTTVDEPVQSVKETPAKPVEIYETAGGDVLRALLAFIPVDVKNLQTCAYDCLLINDSNYFLFYNIVIGVKEHRHSVANGILEPNIQEEIVKIEKQDLNDWENIQVQLVAYKQMKDYTPQPAKELNLRIAPVKFYKLHSFTDNEYFDEPAMIIDLIGKQDTPMSEIQAEDIKKAMFEKEKPEAAPVAQRKKIILNAAVIEVDLHINELVDNTSGLSNADMLQLQMDKFHAVIDENKNKKGQKIVFIHGKGEGVLRNEILKQLKTRYKSFYFQDASFREYGFGATMVVIK